MPLPVLEISDLSAGFDGVAVVRGLSLHVEAGEVVALLGSNGAGKTTTLLTVSGILPILSGTIMVHGESIAKRSAYKIAAGGVAHVPEGRALFGPLTVQENLALATRRRDVEAIKLVLGVFPALGPILDRKANVLSGGEQQMVAMARALVSRPKLLLIDEMSLGLAPIIVEKMLPVVRQIADETGCGVLLVEQHVDLALEVSDRAYVLAHGKLVNEGDAKEFLKNRAVLESSYMGEAEIEGSSG